MNFVEWHFGDWAKDAAHLSMIEAGAYRLLIEHYYVTETPLPADVAACCRFVRAVSKPERAAVRTVLGEFFTAADDGWHHKRCDAEIARFRRKSARASASANARWTGMRTHSERNANAMPTHSERNAKAMPHAGVPLNQKPLNHQDSENLAVFGHGEPAAPATAPSLTDAVFALGVPLLVAGGVTDRHARSMLGLASKLNGEAAVVDALNRCASERPVNPVAWMQAALRITAGGESKSDRIARHNAEVVRRMSAKP